MLAGVGITYIQILDFDKSEFEAPQIKYLGFIIRVGHGIAVDPAKVQALREWQPPKTVRGVRGFLGFANFYRTFVEGYANIARPMYDLTKKGVKFEWRSNHQQAFEALRDALMNAPVLARWDPTAPTVLEV